jgi:hypothetical protein
MTNFGHFTNFDGNKLSNCNLGDTNIFSYYYFVYILFIFFISCVVVAWWAIFVVELRSLGWPITGLVYLVINGEQHQQRYFYGY